MKRGFSFGEQEKVLFTALISIALIVAVVTLSGKDFNLKGAATVDSSLPLLELKMDDQSLGREEVLEKRGVYETSRDRGKIKNGWKFDGAQDYAIISSNDLKEAEDFTIMFWMKPSDSSLRKRAHILWQGELNEDKTTVYAGDGWGNEQELHISLGDELGNRKYSDHQLTFYFGDREGDKIKMTIPIRSINWQHVAVAVENDPGFTRAELFLDGTSVGRQKILRSIDRNAWDSNLNLGKAGSDGPATDSNRFYSGLLDELTIHDRVLTGKEISKLCRAQNDGDVC